MVVVLDQHPSHTSNKVKKYLKENAIPLYLPTASSSLNNVERCWHIIKSYYEKQLFHSGGYMTQDQMRQTVEDIISKHLDGNCLNLANGNK